MQCSQDFPTQAIREQVYLCLNGIAVTTIRYIQFMLVEITNEQYIPIMIYKNNINKDNKRTDLSLLNDAPLSTVQLSEKSLSEDLP